MKEKAIEQLEKLSSSYPELSIAYALRGIGYAVLELADAIRSTKTSEERRPE